MSQEPQSMRGFLTIWFGQLVSVIGSGLTRFALIVWLFQQSGAALPLALIILCSSIVGIVLSPLAGVVADRYNRRLVIVLADTGSALATLGLFGLLQLGQLELWHMALFVSLHAAFGTFQEPAYTASITMLVPKQHLERASGMGFLIQALDMMLVPSLAAALTVWIGLEGVILVDITTFLIGIGALLLVRIPMPAASAQEQAAVSTPLRERLLFGWRYLRERRGLLQLVYFFALVNFLINFASVLMAPLVLSFASPAGFGLVESVMGVCTLAGSLIVGVLGRTERRVRRMLLCFLAGGAGLLIAGLQPMLATVALGMGLMMFSIPLASSASQALFQLKVEPAVQGRVFAIRGMIARSMMPLAFLSSGLLADYVFEPLLRAGGGLADTQVGALLGVGPGRGIGLMFVIAGGVLLVATALAARSSISSIEDALPDYKPASVEAPPASGDAVTLAAA